MVWELIDRWCNTCETNYSIFEQIDYDTFGTINQLCLSCAREYVLDRLEIAYECIEQDICRVHKMYHSIEEYADPRWNQLRQMWKDNLIGWQMQSITYDIASLEEILRLAVLLEEY